MPGSTEPYNQVVVFDDTEGETIIGRSPYNQVLVFDESEVEPIIAQAPPVDDRPGPGPDADGPDGDPPALDAYRGTIAEAPAQVAGPYGRVIADFAEAEGLLVVADPPPPAPPGGSGSLHTRTTGPEDRPPWWPESTGISFELEDAWQLPPPADIDTELPLPQTQVLSWLRAHRDLITAAEKRRHVDRRAIAAAIAWEALVNIRTVSVRAVGPGKVHVDADVVHEIEEAGYLPRRTSGERRRVLATPAGAIDYIAAIMAAKADAALHYGFDIRTRVDILTNEFQGRSLRAWKEHLAAKRDTAMVGENLMSPWSLRYLHYLELAVGNPLLP